MEPYTISDLAKLLDEIRGNPLVDISEIGRTVQGRPLEMIRVGSVDAPHRVLIRARAHPWESGGNWVVQGLIRSLLTDDPANKKYLARYAVHILPIANKDGVAAGWTRFNMCGMDLNRKWDKPADPDLAPENAAFERWISDMIRAGRKPDLAFDLHNDQSGLIHISRPDVALDKYLADMTRYETLLRQHTWFTEGHTGGSFHNPGSFGEGMLERFGVTAFVQELNANWIEGLQENTGGRNWELLGSQYRKVFYEYFEGR
jgi:murein tripeptide amidase MpaA